MSLSSETNIYISELLCERSQELQDNLNYADEDELREHKDFWLAELEQIQTALGEL